TLGHVGRLWPAFDGSLDLLRLHVGPLYDAHGHRRATSGDSPLSPLGNTLKHRKDVWEIGLQGDASIDLAEAWSVERLHEHLRGDLEVSVFLHVQIDEFRRDASVGTFEGSLGRRSVQTLHTITEHRDGPVAGDWDDLRIHSRHLDADAID